jgi:uncharacterized protein
LKCLGGYVTMALPLSGSVKEDVELIVIETSDFSLVIKGKPYHERYLGLQQYKSLDFHDVMTLDIKGKNIEVKKVFDVNSQMLVDHIEHDENRPIFFENGIYQVIVSPKNDTDLNFYHEHPLLRKAIDRVEIGGSYVLLGNLNFQSEIGYSTFEIRCTDQPLIEITIEVFPTKLDYKEDYRNLLKEVNDEIYNLAFHFLKKTFLSAKTRLEGNPSLTEFFRLISVYFDAFIKSIDQIERQPHHRLEKRHEITRGDRLKNVDSKGRNFLRKNSHFLQSVNKGIEINNSHYMPLKGLNSIKEITYDTHENRYIKWMMNRLIWKVDHLLSRYVNRSIWTDFDQETELKDLIMGWKNKLERKLNSPFWSKIRIPDRAISSLVLQLAPGYRDAYQIFLTVSKGLTLQSSIHKMSVKDVATLYEYWTYLKLGQILNRKYDLVSQDIIKVNRDGLYVNLEANRQATRVYMHPVTKEKITLTYQKYEGPLPTISQRPDTMLSIEKKGENYSFNYVFDAKYRIDFAANGSYYANKYVSPGPMEEDINTMHRYRDSIVAEHGGPYERTAFGAYVLFPWNGEQVFQDHHFYKSIEKVNIGGFPFLPNATNLVERFIENLIEKSPEEIQKEGILPRGSLEKWKELIEEKVLVGVVSTLEQYRAYLIDTEYNILLTNLKNGWQEAKYIALYLTKEVGRQNGVLCFGKITSLQIENEMATFKVLTWTNLEQVIKPVNYGIAVYTMTTLQNLIKAKELPELFMKSDEEKMIWQLLRRMSNQVRIDLDKPILDDAKHINNFSIKDVEISLDFNKRLLFVNTRESIITIDLMDFQNKPTSIFKLIIKELEGNYGLNSLS